MLMMVFIQTVLTSSETSRDLSLDLLVYYHALLNELKQLVGFITSKRASNCNT